MKTEEIIEKAKTKHNEDMFFELKEISKLINPLGCFILKPLHESIVAFANREGGRIIIGIKTDGKPEGRGIFDELGDEKQLGLERFMNAIIESTQCAITPKIDISLKLHQKDEYEFIEVVVPQRSGVAHALIERENENYEEKLYYMRSSNCNHLVCPLILK